MARENAGAAANKITAEKPADEKESACSKNELSRNISYITKVYKKFAFDIASKIPYSSMPSWIKCADGKFEEVLDEKRTLMRNVKDTYAFVILNTVLGLIAFWYIFCMLFVMVLFGGVITLFGMPTILLNNTAALMPSALIFIFVAIVLLILPLAGILLQSAVYHVLAKVLGGKAPFADTTSIVVLSVAAMVVLLIPLYLSYAIILGHIFSSMVYIIYAYMFYLQYRGIRHLHMLSHKRAAAVIIGAFFINFALTLLFVLAMVFLLPTVFYNMTVNGYTGAKLW